MRRLALPFVFIAACSNSDPRPPDEEIRHDPPAPHTDELVHEVEAKEAEIAALQAQLQALDRDFDAALAALEHATNADERDAADVRIRALRDQKVALEARYQREHSRLEESKLAR